MSVYTNTTLTGLTIDRKWDMDLLEARYAASVVLPRVLNKSEKVSKSGEIISIQIKPKYTSQIVAAGGGFTPVNTPPTQANITVGTWRAVPVEIDKQAEAQSFWDPTTSFGTDAGKVLATDIDTDLLALHSGLDELTPVNEEGSPSGFDDQTARTALLRIVDANIANEQTGFEDLSFILAPVAWYQGWLSKTELTAAYATGLPKSLQTTGAKTPILGVPAFMSTVVATVGSARKCVLIHRQAWGCAMQRDHEFKVADRTAANVLGKVAVVDSLYGVATIRADHGVVINVAAA